jgi:hypothetical protein
MFFAALESQFRIHKITEEQHKYSLLINAVTFSDMGETASTHIIKEPDTDPYSVLKTAILEAVKPTDYNQVRAIMAKEKLGDLKPTEFFAKLCRHADPEGKKDKLVMTDVRDNWLRAMPHEWHSALMTITDLQEAAKVADSLKYWGENPVTQAIYQAATKAAATPVEATLPVAAVTSPGGFGATPQVAATSSMSDSARLAKLEEMMTQMSMMLMSQQHFGGGSNNNNSYRYDENNRGGGGGRRRDFNQRGRDRSQSPARINNGVCYYHNKFHERARRCDEGCLHFNQFMAEQGSDSKSSNFQGRP